MGTQPVLLQRLCVDVVPVSDLEKLQQAKVFFTHIIIIFCFNKKWGTQKDKVFKGLDFNGGYHDVMQVLIYSCI